MNNKKINSLLDIEVILNLQLPFDYIEWFNSGGPYEAPFRGSDCSLKDLIDLNECAEEILNESYPDAKLPENSFIFYMHQGYVFLYFICDGNNNPPVWIYNEGDYSLPYIMANSFTECVKKFQKDYENLKVK